MALPCCGSAEQWQESSLGFSCGRSRGDQQIAAVIANSHDRARLDLAQVQPSLRTHPSLDPRVKPVERGSRVRE